MPECERLGRRLDDVHQPQSRALDRPARRDVVGLDQHPERGDPVLGGEGGDEPDRARRVAVAPVGFIDLVAAVPHRAQDPGIVGEADVDAAYPGAVLAPMDRKAMLDGRREEAQRFRTARDVVGPERPDKAQLDDIVGEQRFS